MHALKKNVINNRSGVYTFGEILLGVEDKAVVAYFANPKNIATTRAIEAVTYGAKKLVPNPLENESRGGAEEQDIQENYQASFTDPDDSVKKTTIDVEDMDAVEPVELSPQQKAAITRANNLGTNKR
jgi:hypothetical protein